MAEPWVLDLEPEVIRALEERARRNHRSLDDEVYEILRKAIDKEDEENPENRQER